MDDIRFVRVTVLFGKPYWWMLVNGTLTLLPPVPEVSQRLAATASHHRPA